MGQQLEYLVNFQFGLLNFIFSLLLNWTLLKISDFLDRKIAAELEVEWIDPQSSFPYSSQDDAPNEGLTHQVVYLFLLKSFLAKDSDLLLISLSHPQ